MACKCTCGGCDCRQVHILYAPDIGAAPPIGPVTIRQDSATAADTIHVRYDAGAAGAAAPGIRFHEMIHVDPH